MFPWWWTLGALAVVSFLSLFAFQYVGYLRSRRQVVEAYQALALLWSGRFDAGTFFVPPALSFSFRSFEVELRAFYLYRGLVGNYTQLRYSFGRSFLHAFVVRSPDEDEEGYDIESVRPELVRSLLEQGWTREMDRLVNVGGRQDVEVRFDGDTLTVRKRSLLLSIQNLKAFRESVEAMCIMLDERLKGN